MNKTEILEILDYYADRSNWEPKSYWSSGSIFGDEEDNRTEVVVVPIAEVDAGKKARDLAKKLRSEE